VPFGGAADQGFLFIPDPGAGVWVEFEEGDLEFPIWVGTFWSKPDAGTELPNPNGPDGAELSQPQDPPTCKIIKTAKGHTVQLEDADGKESVLVCNATGELLLVMDTDGVRITDGKRGNKLVMDSSGITVNGPNGNTLVVGTSGIEIGGGAQEQLVLGTTLSSNVQTLITSLNTHTHVGNLGAPTSPPVVPMTLVVPLSASNTVK
jgi:uncharacterized protein involved in type VI secretion and phage assembly